MYPASLRTAAVHAAGETPCRVIYDVGRSECLPSACCPNSQPSSTLKCSREYNTLSGTILCFFLFYIFFVMSPLILRMSRSECANQAPMTTVCTYPKHSRTTCNRPCREQQSTCSGLLVPTRQIRTSVWPRAMV